MNIIRISTPLKSQILENKKFLAFQHAKLLQQNVESLIFADARFEKFKELLNTLEEFKNAPELQ